MTYYNLIEDFIDIEKWSHRLDGKLGKSATAWYQTLLMIGLKWARVKDLRAYNRSYIGCMFYWFAIFWNNTDPDMWYGGGEAIPWHGFTIHWGPNATGEPGALLWKNKKELYLWRSSLRLSMSVAVSGLKSRLKGFGKTGREK